MFKEYEFHFETNLCFSELMQKFLNMGYKYKVKLLKDESGVEVYIMTDSIRIEMIIDLYEEKNGSYTYEVKTKSLGDFTKMHDIMSTISE